jgi:hypothetical protein
VILEGDKTARSAINKSINSIWKKKELPEEWKKFIIAHIHKGEEAQCSNYSGTSLSSTTYTILSIVLLLG